MPTEGATYIDELTPATPAGSASASEGDDEIRQLKTVLTSSFPYVSGAVAASDVELSYMDGVTSNVQTQLNGKMTAYLPQSVKTDNFNVAAGNHYILRTNSSKTATFPASASAGDEFWITNTSGGSWTGARNGLKVMGIAADETLSNATHYEYVYTDSTTGWAKTRAA